MKKFFSALAFVLTVACSTDDGSGVTPQPDDQAGFDRSAMLSNWADNIIVPAYQAYSDQLDRLQTATAAFVEAPGTAQLASLRTAWLDAYVAWQQVEMFEIGKAEEVSLRNYTNIFPTSADEIEENIQQGTYTLELPSQNDAQGFPALDYLLYGVADTDEAIVGRYTDATLGTSYQTYLSSVVQRMVELTELVVSDWEGTYRDTFVANTGSSATASINKLANDYLFYYEQILRKGKVGLPAGVYSSTPLPETVEGRYAGDVSKLLLEEALGATQRFFNGQHFAGDAEGESFASYLTYLNSTRDGEDLVARINAQFNSARQVSSSLNSSFEEQVRTNNQVLLTTYDELQRNVVLMKVDMFQALNVKVDFVDNDGD